MGDKTIYIVTEIWSESRSSLDDDCKTIGVFSSRKSAAKAMVKMRNMVEEMQHFEDWEDVDRMRFVNEGAFGYSVTGYDGSGFLSWTIEAAPWALQ